MWEFQLQWKSFGTITHLGKQKVWLAKLPLIANANPFHLP